MTSTIEFFLNIGLPFLLMFIAYFVGSAIERAHFRRILAREQQLAAFPVVTFETLPDDWQVGSSDLVSGAVIISLDYFKRIIASLRSLIGGRVKTYESLLDRGRREAVLRMTEEARRRGFDAVINVRLETSRLANSRRGGKGVAGIEMLAYGTAITLN
jgi:uncharacterized protein YbjQ (UPF0145 family)